MKTYNDLISENFLFANPMLKLSALKGVYRAVEELVKDAVVGGAKFIVKNPQMLLAGAILIDYSLPGEKGAMTRKIADYFRETFPGHAMAVYNMLADISVETETQPTTVAQMVSTADKSIRK